MSENKFRPARIYIHKKFLSAPLTDKVLQNAGTVPVEVISDPRDVIFHFQTLENPVEEGKRNILITGQKGDFIKSCPCTPSYLGCNYTIINLDLNCPLDCSYCILQQYLSNPMITLHANTQDLWEQLDVFLSKEKNRIIRIGTGELGDSLVLDHLTERSKELIAFFRSYPKALLELKTKSINIGHVLDTKPAPNIVLAWSLNAETLAESEEKGAPSVYERIEAAKEVCEYGYRVAFHFDPIVYFPGWKKGYTDIIHVLLEKIDPDRIAWISMGSLRFPASLKEIIKKRFPQSHIIYEEMIKGLDGKLRYFKPLRKKMYREIVNAFLGKGGKNLSIYFCMESIEVWRDVLKKKPANEEEVEKYLASFAG